MNITDITPIKPESNAPIRLAAYCRVSSDSEDQLHSFAAQIRYYTDYAKNHPEYSLVDIYADAPVIIGLINQRSKKCWKYSVFEPFHINTIESYIARLLPKVTHWVGRRAIFLPRRGRKEVQA